MGKGKSGRGRDTDGADTTGPCCMGDGEGLWVCVAARAVAGAWNHGLVWMAATRAQARGNRPAWRFSARRDQWVTKIIFRIRAPIIKTEPRTAWYSRCLRYSSLEKPGPASALTAAPGGRQATSRGRSRGTCSA